MCIVLYGGIYIMRKKYIIGGMVLVATAAAVVTISANGIAGNMTSDITSSSNIAYETMMEESEAKLAVAEKNAVAAAKSSKENELKEYFEDKAIINTDIIKNYVKVYETAAEKKEDEVAIGKIDADTIVTVSQKGEKWTRVRAGNQKGWVRTKNLIFGDDAAKKVGTDAEFTVVTNEKVKIYKDTDMNSEVVATLKKEKSYDVKEKTENWLKVNTSDGDAYLRLHNVELKWTSEQAEAEKESKEAEAKKASEKAAKEESKKAAEQSKAAEESWLAESAAQAAAEEAARQAAAQAAAEEAARQAAAQQKQHLGTFRITHYCSCPICCGQWSTGSANVIGASGMTLTPGQSIAVNPAQIPYGSKVMINGQIYIAADTGVGSNCIDIYTGTNHAVASAGGMYYADVYLVK